MAGPPRLALDAEPYTLIVLDLGLPRMSGLELMRALRAEGNRLPVLILTARDTVADRVGGPRRRRRRLSRQAIRSRGADGPRCARSCGAAPGAPSRCCGTATWCSTRPRERSPGPGARRARAARVRACCTQLLLAAGRVLSREQLERTLYGWD